MAARRLIVVLILLLIASVVAASIAPDRVGFEPDSTSQSTDQTTETTTDATTEEPDAPEPETSSGIDGDDLQQTITASTKKPETVRAKVGDQLALQVISEPPASIAIERFGLLDFAATNAPARFDLLLEQAGTYAITDADDATEIVGKLVVTDPGASPKEDDAGKKDGGGGKSSGGKDGDSGKK